MMSTQQGPRQVGAGAEAHQRGASQVAEATRAVTRPIVTVLFASALAGMAVEGIDPPGWFLALAIPCITWWFGERAYIHRKERNNELYTG